MKHYPSIPKDLRKDEYLWCFGKFDGSQIRAEWNPKKGFYKFGTKEQLIDDSFVPFGAAISLIKDKYQTALSNVFHEHKWQSVLCFFEFFGPSSFAGSHNFSEPMDVVLFDVNPYKKGILPPYMFLDYFEHVDIPPLLYEGFLTTDIVDQIKESTLPGMPFEGVIFKGDYEKNSRSPIMFKVKSRAWLNKLKEYCQENEELFNKLS